MILSKKQYALQEAKWLTAIPPDWHPLRLKEIARVSPPCSDNGPNAGDACSVIPMEAVTERGAFNDYETEDYEIIPSGLTNFEDGDVIFAKITPCMENGKGAFVEKLKTKYAFGSTEFHVFRPNYLIDGKFLYYYTYDPEYRKYAAENMTGAAGQKRVSTRFIKYTPVFLPDVLEQKRIALFLKQQCSAIDKTIEIKKEQLTILDELRKSIIHKAVTKGLDENVEFVDSGIESIGKVPLNWKIDRIKDVAEIITGNTPSKDDPDNYNDGAVPWIKPDQLRRNIVNESEEKLSEKGTALARFVPKDAILVGCIGDVGNFAIAGCRLTTNQQINSLIFNERVHKPFAKYLVEIARDEHKKNATLVVVPIINKGRQGQLYLVLPPKNEQIRIQKYLDKKISAIESVRTNIQQQIDVLVSYRASLIHECVTGKRRITD